MSEPLSDLDLTALAHAKAVEALEDQAMATMARAWAGVVKALEGDLDAVLVKVAKAREAGKPLSPAWAYQEDRVRVLLANARENVTRYAQVAAHATTQVQTAAAEHGHAAASAAVDRATAGLGASFAAATPETLGVAVGFLADGSPLAALLATLGQDAAQAVSDAIVQGVTLGHGVDVMRRAAMSAGNLPRHRAETIVRTEAMRVYREAHRQTYLANDDVLTGWTWRAHLDSATCACCVVMDGTAHPTDERLDGHPRCRCAMVPATQSWADLGLDGIEETTPAVRSGKDWLTRQTPTVQRHVLGSGKFREWKAGRITLDDMVARPSSPRWGTMRRERSLIEIRQGRNANYHAETTHRPTQPAPLSADTPASAFTYNGRAEWDRWAQGRDVDVQVVDEYAARARDSAAQDLVRARDYTAQAQAALDAQMDRLRQYVPDGRKRAAAARKDSGVLNARHLLEQERQRLAEAEARMARYPADTPLPDFTADNPLAGYGNRLVTYDRSETTRTHLRELEEHVPLGFHRAARDHMAATRRGGFYVGDRSMPELDDLGEFRGVQPRGWPSGSTWDNVPGAYDGGRRVCACGGGGKGHGSTSLALHEGGHAMDDAVGSALGGAARASGSTTFRAAYDSLADLALNPYYTAAGNPAGYLSEAWAEGFAAWAKARHLPRHQQGQAVSKALLGHDLAAERMAPLLDYFTDVQRQLDAR